MNTMPSKITLLLYYIGIGGLTIRKLRAQHTEAVVNIKPDIVFIHLGSNDLTHYFKTPENMGSKMEDLVKIF